MALSSKPWLNPQVGDLVRLKSGGPTMTVIAIAWPGVTCVWIDPPARLHAHVFHVDMLDHVEESE